MAGTLRKLVNLMYKVYYRVYYLLFTKHIITHSKQINPPRGKIVCEFVFDNGFFGVKHHNFLLVPIQAENRWLFWRRHFAFSFDHENWFKIPSLTPWSTEPDNRQRYGLNSEIVRKIIEPDGIPLVYFCTWK